MSTAGIGNYFNYRIDRHTMPGLAKDILPLLCRVVRNFVYLMQKQLCYIDPGDDNETLCKENLNPEAIARCAIADLYRNRILALSSGTYSAAIPTSLTPFSLTGAATLRLPNLDREHQTCLFPIDKMRSQVNPASYP